MNNQVAQTDDGAAAGVEQIKAFLADLERQGKSPHTLRNYWADLRAFGRWFDGTNHEEFAAELITPDRCAGILRLSADRQAPGTGDGQPPSGDPARVY